MDNRTAETVLRALRPRPLLDANADEVPLPDAFAVPAGFRAFMAGRVPAKDCPHYIAASESRAGFTRCERC